MLHSQCIKEPRAIEAGEYYSVMSRHTLDDGRTPDPEIACDPIHHWRQLAPPARLVGDWYRGRLGAQTSEVFEHIFAPRYLDYLATVERSVILLGQKALVGEVIVMCIEPSVSVPELLLCHRRLLVARTANLTPGLEVSVR